MENLLPPSSDARAAVQSPVRNARNQAAKFRGRHAAETGCRRRGFGGGAGRRGEARRDDMTVEEFLDKEGEDGEEGDESVDAADQDGNSGDDEGLCRRRRTREIKLPKSKKSAL